MYILSQISKTTLAANSFAKALSRTCRKFLNHEEMEYIFKPNARCDDCGSANLEFEFQAGCVAWVCRECGLTTSKCD